ncbi:MAG: lysylphosphatidylglycerol synthase transmembrane domain-containing protein [Candidatus Binatia bacterium]
MRGGTSGVWKRVAKVAVSLGLLAYLLQLVELSEIVAVLSAADPTLLALGFLLYLAGQAVSAAKWGLLSVAVGFRRPAPRFLAYYFIAMFFNAFGLGTVGGDVIRALSLAGEGGRRTLALNTVVADRVSGLLVLLAIALVSLVSFRTYELPGVLYWTTLMLSGALLAGWRIAPVVLPRVLPEGSWPRRLVEVDLAPYWNDYALLAKAGAISLVFHLSQVAVLMCLAAALGIAVPWTYYFIFGPLVNVFSALPISWNGLGIREGGYVFFLGHIGIARELAVAFGLVWFAMVILGGVIGGVVYLFLQEVTRPSVSADE